ncbi:HlyC/CorC family transporter [Sesbania bispinosa]|nr:HlyC/CorC family transporter [Sesbania bispinosa]
MTFPTTTPVEILDEDDDRVEARGEVKSVANVGVEGVSGGNDNGVVGGGEE